MSLELCGTEAQYRKNAKTIEMKSVETSSAGYQDAVEIHLETTEWKMLKKNLGKHHRLRSTA